MAVPAALGLTGRLGRRRLARATRAAHALAGTPTTRVSLVGGLLDLLTPGGRRGLRRAVGPADPQVALAARSALAKLAGPCWAVRVRYGVSGPAGLRGRLRAHALAAAFAAYRGRNRLSRQRLWRPARTLAVRPLHHSDLLAAGELAALAHLPIDPAVPGLAGPAPARPTAARAAHPRQAPRGPRPRPRPSRAAHRHRRLPPPPSAGATGSGKSTLIANRALHDITQGRGVVVIDPKGDLVTDLLDRLPDRALSRLVLLDPDERAAPPTLNPLEGDDPDLAVDHLVGILHRIWIALPAPLSSSTAAVPAAGAYQPSQARPPVVASWDRRWSGGGVGDPGAGSTQRRRAAGRRGRPDDRPRPPAVGAAS